MLLALKNKMSITSNIVPSTPKQKKYIFWHLGLDVKDCSLSLGDAADLIGQMKKDPKFVYDYLIENYGAKLVDPSKIKKAINKKEKSMNSLKEKTKADLCRELYESDNTLTAKQISQKVKCDLSVVYRSLASKPKNRTKVNVVSLKYRQVLNHIKKTPYLQSDNALTLENLAESYNESNKSSYSINDFSRCMAMIVKKGYGEKIGRGVYCIRGNSEVEIKKKPTEYPIKNDGGDKAYEYAVALYKSVGSEEAHKLIDMVGKLNSYL